MTETATMDPHEVAGERVTPLEATLPEPGREVAPAEQVSAEVAAWDLPPGTSLLERAIMNGAANEIIEKLMDLEDRRDEKKAERAFNAAFAEFRSKVEVIKKSQSTSFDHKQGEGKTSYSWETIADIADVVDEILGELGLTYRWKVTSEPNEPITVTFVLLHRDGHYEETRLMGGRDDSGKKNALQQVGSTVKYLERYTMMAGLGLSSRGDPAEDDGKAAGMGETITQWQADEMRLLLKEIGRTESQLITKVNATFRLSIDNVDQLPERYLDEVTAFLESKRPVPTEDAE